MVAVDGCPSSAVGSTCIKCCTLWIWLQYQFSPVQACSLVWICHCQPHSNPQSPIERLPQPQLRSCVQTACHFLESQKTSKLPLRNGACYIWVQYCPVSDISSLTLINTVWMHSVTNHCNLESHGLHQLRSALDPWFLPHSLCLPSEGTTLVQQNVWPITCKHIFGT